MRDHIPKIRLLPLEQFIVVLLRRNVELVLRLRLRRLEGAGQDAHLDVPNFLRHLGVRHIFIYNNAFDQLRLLQSPAGLALHLDQIEVHVRVVADRLGHAEDGVDLRFDPKSEKRPPTPSSHGDDARRRRHRHVEVSDTEIRAAICAIFRLWTLMIFEDSVVEAVSTRTLSSTFFSKCTVSAIFSKVSRLT